MERCQSGRMGRTRNAVGWKRSRGFKSHPLRLRHAEAWLRSDVVRHRHAKVGY